MSNTQTRKSLVITLGPQHEKPWWWDYISFRSNCDIDYLRISIGNKKGAQITTRDIPYIMLRVFRVMYLSRKKYDFIFTFECDMTSFVISLFQTVFFRHKPRHIILTFIMRENDGGIMSSIKYALMRFIFLSLYKAVCSSRSEASYYNSEFRWNNKAIFIPLLCAPEFGARDESSGVDDFIIAAGRTFRDFQTLIEAVRETHIRLIIVTSPGQISNVDLPDNISVLYDIHVEELNELIERSRFVVLPLENRKISTGQSVLLQAMAMKKAVIVTRTNGTEDYIENMKSGIFVEPNNVLNLRQSITLLYNDNELCKRIGQNAFETVRRKHKPQDYYDRLAENICA